MYLCDDICLVLRRMYDVRPQSACGQVCEWVDSKVARVAFIHYIKLALQVVKRRRSGDTDGQDTTRRALSLYGDRKNNKVQARQVTVTRQQQCDQIGALLLQYEKGAKFIQKKTSI